MFINQYTSFKNLLKTSYIVSCLFIKRQFLFLSNNIKYTLIKIPMNFNCYMLLKIWQKYRFNKILFKNALLAQRYLINKSKLLIRRSICLKILFFIYNNIHSFIYITQTMFTHS